MQFTLNELQGGRVHSEEEDSDIMDDHDEDEDADGGKRVHVLSVDRLQALNQVWGGLAVLCLLIKNIRR